MKPTLQKIGMTPHQLFCHRYLHHPKFTQPTSTSKKILWFWQLLTTLNLFNCNKNRKIWEDLKTLLLISLKWSTMFKHGKNLELHRLLMDTWIRKLDLSYFRKEKRSSLHFQTTLKTSTSTNSSTKKSQPSLTSLSLISRHRNFIKKDNS